MSIEVIAVEGIECPVVKELHIGNENIPTVLRALWLQGISGPQTERFEAFSDVSMAAQITQQRQGAARLLAVSLRQARNESQNSRSIIVRGPATAHYEPLMFGLGKCVKAYPAALRPVVYSVLFGQVVHKPPMSQYDYDGFRILRRQSTQVIELPET